MGADGMQMKLRGSAEGLLVDEQGFPNRRSRGPKWRHCWSGSPASMRRRVRSPRLDPNPGSIAGSR